MLIQRSLRGNHMMLLASKNINHLFNSLFRLELVHASNGRIIKTLRYWPFVRGIQWLQQVPSWKTSNAGKCSIRNVILILITSITQQYHEAHWSNFAVNHFLWGWRGWIKWVIANSLTCDTVYKLVLNKFSQSIHKFLHHSHSYKPCRQTDACVCNP